MSSFPRVGGLRGIDGLRSRLAELRLDLPSDDEPLPAPNSPLAMPLPLTLPDGRGFDLENRFVIQPMEGWDGTGEGAPTDLTRRRWRNFGCSGAAWIWGGEAVAVRADGRANPRQLWITDSTASAIGRLRRDLLAAADPVHPPLVGLQLTHSGRWSRRGSVPPTDAQRFESTSAPRIAFHHPNLDRRAGAEGDDCLLDDDDVRDLVGCFARAARLAQEEGFDFVDVKHCHGYLLHEFLAARTRTGVYGGASLSARTRLLGELIAALRAAAPRLAVAVRLSVFDVVPYRPEGAAEAGRLGPGRPEEVPIPYEFGFGMDARDPARIDLSEPIAVIRFLRDVGVTWVNVTAASPYYAPHVQRPALFPPSDGYAPPEDPLIGVHRLLQAARAVKAAVPDVVVVSSGWTYLQEYIPHVAQACVRAGWFDGVGLGRMALSYPELPADVLAGRPLQRRRLCRTFSDCTTAPRRGFVSGCYPLDPFYQDSVQRRALESDKRGGKGR